MQMALQVLLLFFLFLNNSWAEPAESPWYSIGANHQAQLNVDLYLSSTCPYCHKADAFFSSIEKTAPWLHVNRNIINKDKSALARFSQLLNAQSMDDFAIPSVFFCNSRWVGFASPETTGKDLLHALNYCKQQIEEKGELTDTTVTVLRRWANANTFDSGMTANPSAPYYITVVALMDSYNPCALFCIAGFVALLLLQDQRKQQVLTGLSFISGVMIVHYLQQHNTSTFFGLLPWLRVPAIIIGGLALTAVYYIHRNKTMNNTLLYGLALLMSLILQAYQQTCIMNWSYIFEQWLYNQEFSSAQRFLAQLAYQLMYVGPLLLALLLYTIVIKDKRFIKYSPRLHTIGKLYIIVWGLLLIIYPKLLSHLGLSFILILVIFIGGWILSGFDSRQLDRKSEP